MECKNCKKKLGGGFKQDNGGYKCADCVFIDVEIETTILSSKRTFSYILQCLSVKPEGRKYKKALIDIQEILVAARHDNYYTLEKLNKIKQMNNKDLK